MATEILPTQPLTDNSPMPFGKYRGTAMINVPAAYLLWLYNEGCNNDSVKQYIIANLDGLNNEAGHTKR